MAEITLGLGIASKENWISKK